MNEGVRGRGETGVSEGLAVIRSTFLVEEKWKSRTGFPNVSRLFSTGY